METILVIAELSVKGSHLEDIEYPLDPTDTFGDTLQWCIRGNHAWMIRTFISDHDIRVHFLGPTDQNLLDLARESNKKHYADIIVRQVELNIDNWSDMNLVRKRLMDLGFSGTLEVVKDDRHNEEYAFWNSDNSSYKTISEAD